MILQHIMQPSIAPIDVRCNQQTQRTAPT